MGNRQNISDKCAHWAAAQHRTHRREPGSRGYSGSSDRVRCLAAQPAHKWVFIPSTLIYRVASASHSSQATISLSRATAVASTGTPGLSGAADNASSSLMNCSPRSALDRLRIVPDMQWLPEAARNCEVGLRGAALVLMRTASVRSRHQQSRAALPPPRPRSLCCGGAAPPTRRSLRNSAGGGAQRVHQRLPRSHHVVLPATSQQRRWLDIEQHRGLLDSLVHRRSLSVLNCLIISLPILLGQQIQRLILAGSL
jgi:hypothetical protein